MPDKRDEILTGEIHPAEPAKSVKMTEKREKIREIRGVPLIPQENGRGALLAGGVPGGLPGTGRPPSAIREQLRGSFAERVKVLEEIADDKANKPRDRAQAIEILARYGLGTLTEVSVDTVREKVRLTLEAIRVHCDAELAARLIVALRPIWADK